MRQLILIEVRPRQGDTFQCYQDVLGGYVQRYSDMDGNTIVLPDPCEMDVVDAAPALPGWFTPEDDPVVTQPDPVPASVSDRQFYQALAVIGVATQAEALAAVKTGDLPAKLQALVDLMPDEQKFGVQMLLCGATLFERAHPLVDPLAAGYNQLAQAQGWPLIDTDQLFRIAGAL